MLFTTSVLIVFLVTVDFPLNSNTDTGLFVNMYAKKLVKHNNTMRSNTKEYYYYNSTKEPK